MRPLRTTYHLATNEQDYQICRDLAEAVDPDNPVDPQFPTVYARRDDTLLGFLSTTPDEDGDIVAGPLVMDPTLTQPIFTALRLIEVYEDLLRQAGATSYFFGIQTENARWLQTATNQGYTPYAVTEDGAWFHRVLS